MTKAIELASYLDEYHEGHEVEGTSIFTRSADELRRLAAVEQELADLKAAMGKARDIGFSEGTIAALACVQAQDQQVLWKEIVIANGRDKLFEHAIKNDGDWRWAGFHQYAEQSFGKEFTKEAKRKAKAKP
jgi:hypothetical protein